MCVLLVFTNLKTLWGACRYPTSSLYKHIHVCVHCRLGNIVPSVENALRAILSTGCREGRHLEICESKPRHCFCPATCDTVGMDGGRDRGETRLGATTTHRMRFLGLDMVPREHEFHYSDCAVSKPAKCSIRTGMHIFDILCVIYRGLVRCGRCVVVRAQS